MTQCILPGVAGTQKLQLSQWFTPRSFAERVVNWALDPLYDSGKCFTELRMLEPSAGRGALAKAARDLGVQVTCVDIDPESVAELVRLGFDVYEHDFLDLAPEHTFDLVVMNPPFEGGQTEQHIRHALGFAPRVVCICPLTTLASQDRRGHLWNQVNLNALAICATRPKFGADGGATDMCVIDVNLGGVGSCSWDNVTVEVWP